MSTTQQMYALFNSAQEKLVTIMVSGCTCHTKTPELKYHTERCHYRLASEIGDTLHLLEHHVRYRLGDTQTPASALAGRRAQDPIMQSRREEADSSNIMDYYTSSRSTSAPAPEPEYRSGGGGDFGGGGATSSWSDSSCSSSDSSSSSSSSDSGSCSSGD